MFPRIPRHTERWRGLYRRRAVIERAFGDLKNEYGLALLRVRGLERVHLHADLCIPRASRAGAGTRPRRIARGVAAYFDRGYDHGRRDAA